jgi:hypothetical protein
MRQTPVFSDVARVLHKELGMSVAICSKLDCAAAAALVSVFIVLAWIAYALCYVTGNLGARASPEKAKYWPEIMEPDQRVRSSQHLSRSPSSTAKA